MFRTILCCPNHTTAPATEGAPIPQPTSDEVIASQPDPKLAKKSKALVKWKASTSLVGPSESTQPKRKRRLKSKASEARSSSPVTWRRTKVILLELLLLQSCDLARVFVRLLLACSTLFSLTHLMPKLNRWKADDQAIQPFFSVYSEDMQCRLLIVVKRSGNSGLLLQQMMNGSDIGIQEKRAKLFKFEMGTV
ncbi:hypothetical protein Tco_1121047 [Tanacetum coccineum]|uniref:Uncharacterized protein n=1 Tax=Tanacetum coccineum TaxID=301880 RepID=A0ABQ5IWK5_9ASTR